MEHMLPATVLHWNYRGFTEFPIKDLRGDEKEITDIYLKENLISHIPTDIGKLVHLESLYLSGNNITVLPKEIGNLRCLKCFDLSGNRLRSIPEEIGEMKNLKFLILDENELSELPLRIAELRSLRYYSVCDNKLEWLPQRPVYNYFHCEFRFWRNTSLKTIPYSLWFHMFRGQQTRSLNIGCLSIPRNQNTSKTCRCRLELNKESREWTYDVECPSQHNFISKSTLSSPASLLEISRRVFYQSLSNTAKRLSTEKFSIYTDYYEEHLFNENNNIANLRVNNPMMHNDNNSFYDLNGNNVLSPRKDDFDGFIKRKSRKYYVVADIIDEYFDFLPYFIKQELCWGPVSRCENVDCRTPVFDYAFYEFCFGDIILIDNKEEVVVSAVFCSKLCADIWKKGKTVLSWTLLENT